MNEIKESKFLIYENEDGKVDVDVILKDETIWLTQKSMAKLFEVEQPAIAKHLINIYNDKELVKNPTYSKMELVQKEGKRNIKRNIEFYNLDAIIAVGYRVNSKAATKFRIWATKVLKDYIIRGYAINNKRLEYLEKAIKLIDIANRGYDGLESNDAKEILRVIGEYSKALDLLDDYDHKRISKPKGIKSKIEVTYNECLAVINKLKFNNDSDLFALERNKGLESIINNIYQSYDGKDLYKTLEEKAANFLYLIVKNHTFIDGNKRIGAALFIYFLNFNNILYKNDNKIIDNNSLVAITLLIAQSNPKEKDIIIDLIMNFLVQE